MLNFSKGLYLFPQVSSEQIPPKGVLKTTSNCCFVTCNLILQDNYNRLLLEKPKKPRKKTKPSAMTRPPKKGKKKKNQRRNNKTSKVPSPIPSPEDTETGQQHILLYDI